MVNGYAYTTVSASTTYMYNNGEKIKGSLQQIQTQFFEDSTARHYYVTV
jgi:hypothetical protein